jgi:two-component system, NtrC family, sensor histidine kinase PilS
MFLLAVVVSNDALNLGSHNLQLFFYVSAAYLVAAVLFHAALRKWRTWFNGQLTVHVLTDIAALVLLMNASSGMRSGLGVMLLISLAAAALVSRGTLMLFYAAVASIAVLIEQAYWVLIEDHATANFLQPGLLSIGYFASALITNQLAQRVITNERVARQRGADLANQLRINQLVIQDVQDGVMVVDPNGLVRLHNPQVSALLGRGAPELDQIDRYSAELARQLAEWRSGIGPATATLRLTDSGKLVRVRFVAAGVGGGSFTLVFLEDLSKQQEQAQQLKLAALGRLTANIAHEIRNPLSAITHASDLLREEAPSGGPAGDSTERLVQIILENARRLDRMVSDVLELSRRDRIQPEAIPLSAHVEAFVDEFARNEGVPRDRINVSAEADAKVDFDRTHLNQVLWNLVRNAWRHCRKAANSVRIEIMRRGNRVELHVIDDGEGVPRELQAQLFEPFFTTFSSGTGLGLYIARELCAANRASLEYLDRGRGADFRILWQKPAQ